DQHVADAGVVEGIVGREVRAAGQAEYVLDTLRLQTFHESVGRSHLRSPPFLLFRGTNSARRRGAARGASRASVPAVFRRLRRLGAGQDARGRGAVDSGASTTSGNSSSAPQRVHTASWSITTPPPRGHCRPGSA